MRLSTLVLFAGAALATSAQDAGPRSAWSYDPVEVGNQRAYAQGLTPESTVYWRTDSPTAITRDGMRGVVRRTQEFYRLDSGGGWGRTETRTVVRFDTSSANVIVRSEDGTTAPLYPCRLDVPLAPTGGTCNGDVPYTKTSDGRLTFEDRGDGFATVLQAGIGVVGGSTDRSPDFGLVGAVIDGVTLVEEPQTFPDSQIDPTPAARYAPMSVGDEWQYERSEGAAVPGLRYHRIEVSEEREIDGQTYLGFAYGSYVQGQGDWVFTAETIYARFDTLSARVLGPDGMPAFGTPYASACAFDEPTTSHSAEDLVFCETSDSGSNQYGESVALERTGTLQNTGDDFDTRLREYPYAGIADYECYPAPSYAAGIGNTGHECFNSLYGYNRLIFARVRQPDGTVLELGERYAVSTHLGPEAGGLALVAGPNPTPGPVTLRLDVPTGGAVRWTATDALGRVVWERGEIRAPGPATVALDLSDAPAGLYIVRAATASGAATATVVRR